MKAATSLLWLALLAGCSEYGLADSDKTSDAPGADGEGPNTDTGALGLGDDDGGDGGDGDDDGSPDSGSVGWGDDGGGSGGDDGAGSGGDGGSGGSGGDDGGSGGDDGGSGGDSGGGSGGDGDTEPDPSDEEAFCNYAEENPGWLDSWQVAGDGKVVFCHAGGTSWSLIDISISACVPHLSHSGDVHPSTGCDS